jgi:IMP dehydrogenase
MNKLKQGISYDDILLVPRYSEIQSRADIDISSDLGRGVKLKFPVISSPMDTISESAMGLAMAKAGGTAVIHRYNSIESQCAHLKVINNMTPPGSHCDLIMGAAVGVSGDYLERAQALREQFVRYICIDVAHGHHIKMKRALYALRKVLGDGVHIMAGNVATIEAFNDLADWGADSIRVGIGGGSICSTRIQTGHGVPTLQSVMECANSDRDAKLIVDGGIRNSGDMVKAFACGADAAMCGSLLAGTDEAPGSVYEDVDGSRWKSYRGMASKEAQIEWHGHYNSHEGVATRVPHRGSVQPILRDLEKGIRSGFSYSGACSLQGLQARADLISQTPSGLSESHTHIINRKW